MRPPVFRRRRGAAGFRVSEPLRASPPGMTIAEGMGAASHEAAARLFKGHPHCTMFPCEGVEVMPLLGG